MAAALLGEVRDTCHDAVATLLAAAPALVVLVGDAPATGSFAPGTLATFAGFGIDLVIRQGAGPVRLPLSLTVGTWLLDRAGYQGARLAFGVSADVDAAQAAGVGAVLAQREERVAMLVMGDGAARRDEISPGWAATRGVSYDGTVAAALASADVEVLRGLDQATAADLWVAGRASWQVLAGAAGDSQVQAELLLSAAPLGVGYHVATWLLDAATPR